MHKVEVSFVNTDYRWGFHIRKKSPSFLRSLQENSQVEFNCFQIYLSNSRSGSLPKFDLEDLLKCREYIRKRLWYLCIHGNLLYNFCGSTKHKKDPKFDFNIRRYCNGLVRELDIGVALGAGVVIHPGSCKEKTSGIETIAKCLAFCLTKETPEIRKVSRSLGITISDALSKRKVILENASGAGTQIAVTLEEISEIILNVPENLRKQVKVCVDTAHAFGAGLYRWGEPQEVKRFYKDFQRIIGLEYLEVFHLNDSRKSEKKSLNAYFGSRKDRHENLGLGYIFSEDGLKGLKEFFLQAKERRIPIIGEPPARTEHGSLGPGGRRDWPFVADLLGDLELRV